MNVFVLFGIGIEFLDKTCKTVCVCVRALVWRIPWLCIYQIHA